MVRKAQWAALGRGARWIAPSPDLVKKQLRMGGARRLCSGHPPERSAWLESYGRDLLTPARCAERPTPAREAGQHWLRRASGMQSGAPLAGSDDAEARRTAGGRCGGFAQSCGWRWTFDRGRSGLRSLHQQGSWGRFSCVSVRDPLRAHIKTSQRGLAHSEPGFSALRKKGETYMGQRDQVLNISVQCILCP
jgi:hypothetical protein